MNNIPIFDLNYNIDDKISHRIAALLRYYGIETEGKKIVIIGKGALVGAPLAEILTNYPYNGTVTACDIFT